MKKHISSARYQNHNRSAKHVTLKKVKKEMFYNLRKAKESVYQRSGPLTQNLKAELISLWRKYMDGRSRTEKIIIGIIALSFFILLIILIVEVARK
jgi:hypothetical protein